MTFEDELFFENFNLAHKIYTVNARVFIYHMSVSSEKTFPWKLTNLNSLTLTIEFVRLFENFNLVNYIRTAIARALIFHMNILVIKSFCWYLTFWPWHLIFFKLLNNKYYSFHVAFYHFCDKNFLLVPKYLSLWSWPSLELAIIRVICVSQIHLVCYLRIYCVPRGKGRIRVALCISWRT